MTEVLGLNPLRWRDENGEAEQLTETVDHLVRLALQQRQAARERKDYAAGDAIRDSLAAAGVLVEDTPAGPRWKLDH
jgi:cysteinyl-tRNA synthetase